MKKKHTIFITKASGEPDEFSRSKLRDSLRRAGANDEQIDSVIQNLTERLYEGISTKKIYRMAFNLLKAESKPVAAKYHLKRAIMELGPSGYPFEKFIAEILSYQNYKTSTGIFLEGQCVRHEIDVIAEKEDHHFMVECKYHNQPGTFCDVKIPLYIQARFKDVEAAWLQLPGHSEKFHQGWVVTNTRFTSDAIQYGTCAGLKLIGWNYPDNNSLRYQIDTLQLYPVTCLTTLSKNEKQDLLDKKIVLCKELYNDGDLLLTMGISPARINTIMDEVTMICENK